MKLEASELALVMETELFRGVEQEVSEKLINANGCTVERFEKSELVYSPGHFSRCLGIVLSGSLRVTKDNADKRPIVMSTLSEGKLFGAAALFNDSTEYVTSIRAVEPCKVLFLSQELIKGAIRDEPRMAENYITYLSERILFLNRKIYFLTAGTAEQKLAGFLLDNLNAEGYSELPMNRLADALNMSRASLYRALDTLTDRGAIKKDGKRLCISDVETLKGFLR